MPRLNPIFRALACRPPPRSTLSGYVLGWDDQRKTLLERVTRFRRRRHQILAMRTHLAAPEHGPMDPASARYMIRINGHLGATLLSAFPAMASQRQGPETVLTGVLDRAGLHGVLAEIEALGLDLLEVRQLAPEARSPERGDTCSP
jgi:hypothetical protein